MNATERRFTLAMENWRSNDGRPWSDAAPSVVVQAHLRGRKVVDLSFGDRYPYFDWASLTKIVFSTTSAMMEMEAQSLRLDDLLIRWLPELGKETRILSQLTVRHLLSHSAGMTWWKPLYKTVAKGAPRDHEAAWEILFGAVARDVRRRAENGELAKAARGRAVYSDLDFFLLGEILRRSSLMSFSDRWVEVAGRLDLRATWFQTRLQKEVRPGVVSQGSRKAKCAPTENDPWRGRVLQGEVHDENAGSLFGVAPHAGLFGPIDDLSRYGLEVRRLVRGEKSKLPHLPQFVRRSVPEKKGDWALGFMMPTRGGASCGPKFSLRSVGHTGYAGTSLWYDPRRDLLVSIFSNRVHPTRLNTRFLQLRPAIHTMVVDSL